MIATVAPPPSSPVRSLLNIGTTLSATQPSATPSWIASFTTLTVCNSPEKACESRTPAIKLLTPTQTPEPITHVGQSRCSPSRETAAHDRLKSPLTIAEIRRNPLVACPMENLTHYPLLLFVVSFVVLSLVATAGAW